MLTRTYTQTERSSRGKKLVVHNFGTAHVDINVIHIKSGDEITLFSSAMQDVNSVWVWLPFYGQHADVGPIRIEVRA